MQFILPLIQIIIAIFLIVLILLQQRGQALGSVFGGSGEFYAARRGLQKKIFGLTIFLGVAFIITALLNLLWR